MKKTIIAGVCVATLGRMDNAMKKLIATLAICLAIAVSANDNKEYGNWIAITGKSDPFHPGKTALAFNKANENMDIRGIFGIFAGCKSDKPDFIGGPFFSAEYTNFMDTEYSNQYIHAHIAALFDGGKPREIKTWHRPGGDVWYIARDEDQKWLLKGLLENNRLYVRWVEYGAKTVTAEFDLAGATEAFDEAKRRCVDD